MDKKNKSLKIIGISAYYHDSACCLSINGEIISAAQEERFTRKKHDSRFPINAIKFCLNHSKLKLSDIDYIVYYEKPLLTFERLLETYLAVAPRGIRSFIAAMQTWLKEKLFLKNDIKNKLKNLQRGLDLTKTKKVILPELLFSEHHLSHAASAFYPSPFKNAAILCLDGVGEWATTSAWIGLDSEIKSLWEISFPHSLGLLYSSFTYYCGFKVNSGEYKLMGLAPYGKPKYADLIKQELIDIKKDGTYRLNMKYFKFHRGFEMTSNRFYKLFGENPRKAETEITQFHMDIASSIQSVTEEIVLLLAKSIKKETGLKNLCMAGGVALNCVSNGKILDQKIFDNIWIQPASGDAGTSIGASLYAFYQNSNQKRKIEIVDSMKGSYLGPSFSNQYIQSLLKKIDAKYHKVEDDKLFSLVAKLIAQGYVIGWFNGKMEFGPRALGSRSILGDPRSENMQNIMNQKIKFRESFRPFAPSILEEDVSTQFNFDKKSPYMLFVTTVKDDLLIKCSSEEKKLKGFNKLKRHRSLIPAVTHVDSSARIHTVNKKTNPSFYKLLKAFKKETGCSSLINTSFNVRGEPIVCSPKDAYKCFMVTNIDVLVLENNLLYKKEQNNYLAYKKYINNYELD